ncbi:MAG: M48 family metallopeptidase, partial [Planctomycetota bacterium]
MKLVFPVVLVLLSLVAFWGSLEIEEPDPPRSLQSVILLAGSTYRDLRAPMQLVLHLSDEEESEIGARLARQYVSLAERDTPRSRYLNEVGELLAKQARRAKIRYHFLLLPDTRVQAFALLGGWVIVTTSMLEECQSEAELAMVLGHEVAHVDLGHAADLAWNQGLDSLPDPLRASAALFDALARPAYSEALEEEADAYGVQLAVGARYFPDAGLDLFARLADRLRARPRRRNLIEESWADYLETHPPFLRRIVVVERVLAVNRSRWHGKVYVVGVANHRDRISTQQRPDPGELRRWPRVPGDSA